MTETVVGGIYDGVGSKRWIIIDIIDADTSLPWIIAAGDGGGSVQFPLRDADKWLFTLVGMTEGKVLSLDERRESLRQTLEARDRLNRLIARQAKAVEQ